MTEIEEYLTGYYYAIQNLRRLTNELVAAERTYKDGIAMYPGHDFEAIRSKNKKITKPTETAAILLVDTLGATVEDIRHKIIGEQSTINEVQALIDAAGLNGREKEYVRLRYMENRSHTNTYMKLGVSKPTGDRLRLTALTRLTGLFTTRRGTKIYTDTENSL
jgi:DNA-directed RNA polymerase specialized sigma subunit